MTEEERTAAISIYGEVPASSSSLDPEIEGRTRKKTRTRKAGGKEKRERKERKAPAQNEAEKARKGGGEVAGNTVCFWSRLLLRI